MIREQRSTRLRGAPVPALVGVHGVSQVPDVAPIHAPRKICAAIDFSATDGPVLSHALTQARSGGRGAQVVLLHVVQSGAARVMGQEQLDSETQTDRKRLELYCEELNESGVQASCDLGFGDAVEQLTRLVRLHQPDLVILGGHGHGFVGDLVHGTTVDQLRHQLQVPLLVVPANTKG